MGAHCHHQYPPPSLPLSPTPTTTVAAAAVVSSDVAYKDLR